MSEVPILTSPLLAGLSGLRHAFFTRQGGVSEGLYASLNVGIGSDDDAGHVRENRRRAAAALGGELGALATCYQTHSAEAFAIDQAPAPGILRGDALATGARGLICGALAADCAPVLLADAEARVVASAHAGWRGALGGVVEGAVARMVGLGARRERIVAAVGPCIGPASYEVGLDFLAAFTAGYPPSAAFFRPGVGPDKRTFDLPGFVLVRLAEAGVEQREWIGRDTCAEPDLFFSNRRAFKQGETDYGRLLSAIVLD